VSASSLKVLICVEHASTAFGGEAAIPLHLFRVLRGRGIDTWLVTHMRPRKELARLFPDAGDRIFLVPNTKLHLFLAWFDKLKLGRLNYYTNGMLSGLLTQWMGRKIARRLVKEHGIDIVHQPIPVSPKEFSLIRRMGAPVVMGPLNGGMHYPPGFRAREGAAAKWFVGLGRVLSNVANRAVRGKLEAEVVLVANERSRGALPSGVKGKVITLVENGVDTSVWQARQPRAEGGAVRFVYVGRLVDWKGVDLLLEAFAGAEMDATLTIVGEGPQRKLLEELAGELKIEERVVFKGWLAQGECAAEMGRSDVFVLPSLWECGGAVVLEAMCVGLPVVATQWGGPVDYLDESCGILVEPAGEAEFVAGLTAAMERLAGDAGMRQRMGSAGREKVLRDYDWERKVDAMVTIYRELIGTRRGGTNAAPLVAAGAGL